MRRTSRCEIQASKESRGYKRLNSPAGTQQPAGAACRRHVAVPFPHWPACTHIDTHAHTPHLHHIALSTNDPA